MANGRTGSRSQLNSLDEGLRQLDQYLQKVRQIEAVTRQIATNLNSAGGGSKADLMQGLQSLQALRMDTTPGATIGGNGAGAQTSGPSPISGGGGVSNNLIDQLDNSRRRASDSSQILIGGAAAGVGHIASIGFEYQARMMRSGGTDSMGMLEGIGRAAGIGIGIAAGFGTRSWQVGATVGGIAQDVLGSFGRYLGAGQANIDDMHQAFYPFERSIGLSSGSGNRGRWINGANAATEWVNGQIPAQLRMTGPQMAGAVVGISEAMIAGGMSPTAPGAMTFGRDMTDYNYFRNQYNGARGRGDWMVGMQAQAGMAASEMASLGTGGRETMGQTYARRLGLMFGKDIEQGVKAVGPIFGTLPETGGNVADILTRFGAMDTERYLALQNDDLKAEVPLSKLMRSSAGIRSAQRKATLGGLRTRGSAAGALAGIEDEMAEIASLPGGKDSVSYASAAAKARDMGRAAFDQGQTESFGIPYAKLQTQMQISELMPFGTGNRLSMQFRNITMLKGRVNSLQSYMNKRRAAGQLSEDEEMDLTHQIGSAQVGIAGSMATLSEGRENILPGMLAGATRFSGRFTSASLAATALYRSGSPVRSYGAVNGAHLREQDEAFSKLGGDGFETPRSRTVSINNGGSVNEIVSELKKQTAVLERMLGTRSGGGTRADEASGAATGVQARRNLASNSLYADGN